MDILKDRLAFSADLFNRMAGLDPAVRDMELYEFRYGLDNLEPKAGWDSVVLEKKEDLESLVTSRSFYDGIQISPRVNGRIMLDEKIVRLTNMLFVGLVTGVYEVSWVVSHFYFDVRSFIFMHRTTYFTPRVRAHLGGSPFRQFDMQQRQFDGVQDVGYSFM